MRNALERHSMMFIVLFLVTRQAELVSKREGTQAWRILMSNDHSMDLP